MAREFKQSALTLGQLHQAALANLSALRMPSITVGKTPGGPEAFLGDVDDNFRAVRILLPTVRSEFEKELGNKFLVSLPCRDWMFCWSGIQSMEWQNRNTADALKIFLSDEYNLTPDILICSDGTFDVHLTQNIAGDD
jgi:hypothetical protein